MWPEGAEGSMRLNRCELWGSHLLLITSLGPVPPQAMLCQSMTHWSSCSLCELLIPRGRLVTVPRNQHSSPQPSCPGVGVQTRSHQWAYHPRLRMHIQMALG